VSRCAGVSEPEHGSGVILGVAVVGAIMASTALVVPLYIGLSSRASVEGAADAAALAGADVASGISPGDPCEIAASVASANRARLGRCRVDGLVVTVSATGAFMGIPLTAYATAGPPMLGTN
jgi:secretion/DNA translocation related TadE-like protein